MLLSKMDKALGLEAALQRRRLFAGGERNEDLPVEEAGFVLPPARQLGIGQVEGNCHVSGLDLQCPAVTLRGPSIVAQQETHDAQIGEVAALRAGGDEVAVDLFGAPQIAIDQLELSQLCHRPGVPRNQSDRLLQMAPRWLYLASPQLQVSKLHEISPGRATLDDLAKESDRLRQITAGFGDPGALRHQGGISGKLTFEDREGLLGLVEIPADESHHGLGEEHARMSRCQCASAILRGAGPLPALPALRLATQGG